MAAFWTVTVTVSLVLILSSRATFDKVAWIFGKPWLGCWGANLFYSWHLQKCNSLEIFKNKLQCLLAWDFLVDYIICWSGPAPTIPRVRWCVKNFWPLPRSLTIQTKLPEGRKEEVRKQKGEEQREEFEEKIKRKERISVKRTIRLWLQWCSVSSDILIFHKCRQNWLVN